MYVGALEVELLLGDVRSLKHKRAVVRPLLAELRRRDDVAAAETGDADLWRRATIGIASVSGSAGRTSMWKGSPGYSSVQHRFPS